jgi:hypothetical protein
MKKQRLIKCGEPGCDWEGKGLNLHRRIKHQRFYNTSNGSNGTRSAAMSVDPLDNIKEWPVARLVTEIATTRLRIEQLTAELHVRFTP